MFGKIDEGADGCEAALAPLFDDCTLVRSRDGALVAGAAAPGGVQAKKAAARASLHDWRETAALRFPAVTFHAATEVSAWVRYRASLRAAASMS